MRPDLEVPSSADRPLVGNVEAIVGPQNGPEQNQERDETIIRLLGEKLMERKRIIYRRAGGRRSTDRLPDGQEDKYEPQRLSSKICWQYDQTAHKVPLLRRPYI